MKSQLDYRLILCSLPTYESALQLSKILLTEKLAIKCNIQPHFNSLYSWNDTIHENHEYKIFMIAKKNKLEDIEKRMTELYPDDNLMMMAIQITELSNVFFDWIENIESENEK